MFHIVQQLIFVNLKSEKVETDDQLADLNEWKIFIQA